MNTTKHTYYYYWLRYVFILICFCSFAFATSTLITTRLLRKVGTVKVPDVLYKSVEIARSVLRVKKLKLEITEYQFNQRYPINQIISQTPESKTKVKTGRKIKVIVSRGAQPLKVPEIKGLDLRNANISLKQNKLNLGRLTYIYSSTTAKDIILSQEPKAETFTNQGDNINLLISKGPKPFWFLMPDFKHQTLETVNEKLSYLDMPLTEIKRQLDDTLPAGTILDQKPQANLRVKPQTPVGLVISFQSHTPDQIKRLVTIKYNVPINNMETRVKMIVSDSSGMHQIYNAMEKPNSELIIRKTLLGETAKLYIYINGKLAEERNI